MSIYDDASLVMIPSGYKDDKLYSIKPTSGDGDFTFSRDGSGASPATRVNASGLIEKGRTNEILQSNDFNTTWYFSGVARTSGQSGYDGSNDAWEITRGGAFNYLAQDITTSGVQTLSTYAKRSSFDFLLIRFQRTASSYAGAYFDLASGVVGSTDGSGVIDSNIESVGGDWYRISITFNESLLRVLYYPVPSDGGVGTGGSGSVFIQDAQLESGLVATDYIETTTAAVSAGLLGDMPRLDYSGGATCPNLLLEPSRVNKYLFSEYYGAGALSIYATGTNTYSVTNNYGISPEGVQNAIRFVADVTSANDRVVLRDGVSCGGGNHTLTFYAKSNTAETYTMAMHFDGSGKKQIEVTPEWQRFEYGESANTTCNAGIECRNASGYSSSVDVLVYGFQLEENLYPTSYIPTYGSASTRAEDYADNAGDASVFNDTEGVLYLESSWLSTALGTSTIAISDGTNSNRIILGYIGAGDDLYCTSIGGGSSPSLMRYDVGDITTNHKIAIKYKANDFAFWVDGVERGTQSSGTTPVGLSELSFSSGAGGSKIFGNAKQILYFPTALTDAELASLTTL